MKPRIMIMLLVFLSSISVIACSNSKSSSNINNSSVSSSEISKTNVATSPSPTPMNGSLDSKIENIKTPVPSENTIYTVSAEKVFNILSTSNNEVIDSLRLSDSDITRSLNDSRFYVPVFLCKEVGVLIGFNGAPYDSIEKLKKRGETPIFIIPANGTVISFDKNINFRVGDDIKQFKTKFGEGNANKEWNLKGDKQYCFLTYDLSNLRIRFTSLDGDDFKKYDVYITRK